MKTEFSGIGAAEYRTERYAAGKVEGYQTSQGKTQNFEETLTQKGVKAEEKDEEQTKTDIIVKPDGSRVLVVTMHVGGMESTMSLKISEPTDMPNDSVGKGNNDLENKHDIVETSWQGGVDAE